MLRQRVLVAVVGIPILVLVVLAGSPWLTLVLAALIIAACVEMAGLLDRAGYEVQPAVIAGLALFATIAAALFRAANGVLLPLWLATAFIVAGAAAIRRTSPMDGLGRFAGTILAASTAAALSFLLRIVAGAKPEAAGGPLLPWLDEGRLWLLAIVVTVWAYDTAAYFVGRIRPIGRFFAHISPNKTWSGAIGGAVGALLVGLLAGVVISRPLQGLGLGGLVALAAPVGDVTESLLKRAANVKDSSRIFPGHGGILDRMDSFLVVAAVAWLYLVLANLAT